MIRRKGRREHKCVACKTLIPKGQSYSLIKGLPYHDQCIPLPKDWGKV